MTGTDLYDDFMYNSNTALETLAFMSFAKSSLLIESPGSPLINLCQSCFKII